jgi:hypothetical protein
MEEGLGTVLVRRGVNIRLLLKAWLTVITIPVTWLLVNSLPDYG